MPQLTPNQGYTIQTAGGAMSVTAKPGPPFTLDTPLGTLTYDPMHDNYVSPESAELAVAMHFAAPTQFVTMSVAGVTIPGTWYVNL